MSTALANTPENQPKWLSVIPADLQGQLLARVKELPKETKQAMMFVSPDLLDGIDDVDDILTILKAATDGMLTDQQAKYYPAVWKIDHKNQVFVDDLGNVIGKTIRVVILHFQPTRGFWVDGGGKLPFCSAVGTHLQGKAAADAQERWSKLRMYDPNHPIEWSGKEHDCSNCWFNEFGSDPKTGQGKACKEKYRNFLLPLGDDDKFTGEGVMLNAPPTSLKNEDEFVSRLKRYKPDGKKVEPKTTIQVVAELSLEKAEGQGQDYAKVLFKVVRLLTAQELLYVYNIRKQVVAVADTIEVEYGETYGEGEAAQPTNAPPQPDEDVGF